MKGKEEENWTWNFENLKKKFFQVFVSDRLDLNKYVLFLLIFLRKW